MNNSKGFPTNGLYGLVNMLNKIIKEENPKYMLVAFDKGKTFRHEEYKEYKEGRIKMPDDLAKQFVVAKKLLPKMGIKCLEVENYEADDIIGTYSKIISDTNNKGLIVSSDKDLLQLINKNNTVKLLKSHDYIMMDENAFMNTYGLTPDKMIDLKGLMGDPSDNIPGVKGIGEKTALKLLQKYDSIEGLYENIDELSGSTKDKLVEGKNSAFMSKKIATIYKEVPVPYKLEDLEYTGPTPELKDMYNELEFYSFLKEVKVNKPVDSNVSVKIVSDINEVKVEEKFTGI
jgi:DNA polymerase-1